MHNFKMNGNFSKYLSLINSFRLKINYHDSLSAILKKYKNLVSPWLKLFIQALSGLRIEHIFEK